MENTPVASMASSDTHLNKNKSGKQRTMSYALRSWEPDSVWGWQTQLGEISVALRICRSVRAQTPMSVLVEVIFVKRKLTRFSNMASITSCIWSWKRQIKFSSNKWQCKQTPRYYISRSFLSFCARKDNDLFPASVQTASFKLHTSTGAFHFRLSAVVLNLKLFMTTENTLTPLQRNHSQDGQTHDKCFSLLDA